MKQTIAVLSLILMSSSAFANIWNCSVKNTGNPSTWPMERIVADFNPTLNEVAYIHQIPNSDGTFHEKSEPLYSKSNYIRGGIQIAFCDSDQGHIALDLGMVNWTSKCSTTDQQNPLLFKIDMSSDRDGSLEVQVLDLHGGNDINRTIAISPCK